MRAWYASLTERQRFWLAVVCSPLLPVAGALALAAFPFILIFSISADALDDILGESKPRGGKGRSL